MKIKYGSIVFDNGFVIQLHRTIRLPEDDKSHALPPSHGKFPMKRIQDYKNKIPASWKEHGGVFIPMYEREAMWLSFGGTTSAVKVATGKVNAVSGGEWHQELEDSSNINGRNPVQDYIVAPSPQPWLDGFNVGEGQIRQFVAMAMGKGYTVEAQVTGKEDIGGIQVLVVPAKPGKIPAYNIVLSSATLSYKGEEEYSCLSVAEDFCIPIRSKAVEMGLAQGGLMKQQIFKDPHGISTWNESKAEKIFIHIINAIMWKEITGEDCPESPIPASEYKGTYYTFESEQAVLEGSETLKNVKSVSKKDSQHGFVGQQDDSPLEESKTNPIIHLNGNFSKNTISNGKW